MNTALETPRDTFRARILRLLDRLKQWAEHPDTLRRLVRDNQPRQIMICALLGVAVGVLTRFLHFIVQTLHDITFSLPPGMQLSAAPHVGLVHLIAIPACGGLVIGLTAILLRLWRPRDILDPVEANAIYGGRIPLSDNIRLVLLTILSNGAGSSVGMEAAYTQAGAGLFSSAGQLLKLRREDLRIFVTAGSAAAIAAAFNAPLAGAFYGFELILGSYSTASLSQVSAAALSAALTARALTGVTPIFSIPSGDILVPGWNYFFFILLGILSALVGICTMKLVTRCEAAARGLKIPSWIRPAAGGFVLSLIALAFPEVLGSGQGAITEHLHNQWPLMALLALLAAKILGSAVSIGSGFRGGLFSSALFIGCLLGQAAGIVAEHVLPESLGQITSFALVGMGSVAASIVGAPVTMIILILEMTGDFATTSGVLAGVLVSSAITRYYFGYSFSTWRFHLRGLPITGAHDVGWIHDITADTLMGGGAKTIPPEMPLADARHNFPPGSAGRVFIVDGNGHYCGALDIVRLHDVQYDSHVAELTAGALAENHEKYLLARNDIRKVLDLFAAYEMEELPVLKSPSNLEVMGFVSEYYALKRYATELEKQNMERHGSPVSSPDP
jgi:CIC family chloride channel protein